MKSLPDHIAKRIDELSDKGNRLLDEKDDWKSAIDAWSEALELLPEPTEQWEACEWLLASIGEAYYVGEQYQEAFDFFSKAYDLDKANPFISFRLGILYMDKGEEEQAIPLLRRTYEKAGREIFEGYETYLERIQLH